VAVVVPAREQQTERSKIVGKILFLDARDGKCGEASLRGPRRKRRPERRLLLDRWRTRAGGAAILEEIVREPFENAQQIIPHFDGNSRRKDLRRDGELREVNFVLVHLLNWIVGPTVRVVLI
jgi:hypothetical protein